MDINQQLAKTIQDNGIIKFVDIGSTATGALNDAVLPVEKLDRFIQQMEEQTTILNEARYFGMRSTKKDIDRISYDLDLQAPSRTSSSDPTITGVTNQNPTFAVNQLVATKLMAKAALTYEAVEDNIEQGALESTLISLFGGAAGRSLEKIFVYGDKEEDGQTVPSGYKAIDGWMEKVHSTKVLDQGDFDHTDIVDVLETMYDALPPVYLDRARFYVSSKRYSEYRRALKAKDTSLGDEAVLQAGQLTFEGVPLVRAPVLDVAVNVADFFQDEAMFLTAPENFVYGMKRDVMIETDQDKVNQLYQFILSLRADCHFEDEKKVVMAKPATAA